MCLWDCRTRTCLSAFDILTGKKLPLTYRQRNEHFNLNREMPSYKKSLGLCFDESNDCIVSYTNQDIRYWNIKTETSLKHIKLDGKNCHFEVYCNFYFLI